MPPQLVSLIVVHNQVIAYFHSRMLPCIKLYTNQNLYVTEAKLSLG